MNPTTFPNFSRPQSALVPMERETSDRTLEGSLWPLLLPWFAYLSLTIAMPACDLVPEKVGTTVLQSGAVLLDGEAPTASAPAEQHNSLLVAPVSPTAKATFP